MNLPSAKRQPAAANAQSNGQALVSVGWLVRAFIAAFAAAALCGYLTLCFLFYQGQWQVVFHPSRAVATTPASLGVAFDEVRFDYTETGEAQLDGWWIPAKAPGPSARTVLFLHDGRGSLSDVAAQLKALHSLGVNVFAIDYRGFGLSMNTHPSEQRVDEDADAADAYLTRVRHIDPRSMVVYGVGLGATVAAETARRHPDVAGLVLENPAPPALTLIENDPRTKLLPVRLLFRDRFELAPKLQRLRVPKLFLVSDGGQGDGFPAASRPKMLVALGAATAYTDPKYLESIRAFVVGPGK